MSSSHGGDMVEWNFFATPVCDMIPVTFDLNRWIKMKSIRFLYWGVAAVKRILPAREELAGFWCASELEVDMGRML